MGLTVQQKCMKALESDQPLSGADKENCAVALRQAEKKAADASPPESKGDAYTPPKADAKKAPKPKPRVFIPTTPPLPQGSEKIYELFLQLPNADELRFELNLLKTSPLLELVKPQGRLDDVLKNGLLQAAVSS